MRNLLLGSSLLVTAALFGAGPTLALDPGRPGMFVITPNQVVDMADARVAQLKADLRLTPDQDKNWGGFQTAIHDVAVRRADRMNQMREQRSSQPDAANAAPANRDPRAPGGGLPDIVADLRTQADTLTARADDYRRFADAAGPLYGGLDDGQKRRFLGFVERLQAEDAAGAGGGSRPQSARYR